MNVRRKFEFSNRWNKFDAFVDYTGNALGQTPGEPIME